jgi:hypothetical protein
MVTPPDARTWTEGSSAAGPSGSDDLALAHLLATKSVDELDQYIKLDGAVCVNSQTHPLDRLIDIENDKLEVIELLGHDIATCVELGFMPHVNLEDDPMYDSAQRIRREIYLHQAPCLCI